MFSLKNKSKVFGIPFVRGTDTYLISPSVYGVPLDVGPSGVFLQG